MRDGRRVPAVGVDDLAAPGDEALAQRAVARDAGERPAERVGGELRYSRLRVEVAAIAGEHDLEALVDRAKTFCWVSNMLSSDLEVTYVPVVLDPPPADAR